MLLLALHTIEQPTAKVPFSMIILSDLAQRKAIPPELRIRMIIPTSGTSSASLWDAPDVAVLEAWLSENINKDCTNIVFEVQEDFTYGVMLEVAGARTADKVVAGTMHTMSSIKETTAAAAGRLKQTTNSAMENENVAAAVASFHSGVSAGLTRASSALSWMGSKVREQMGTTPATPNNSFMSASASMPRPETIPVSNSSSKPAEQEGARGWTS